MMAVLTGFSTTDDGSIEAPNLLRTKAGEIIGLTIFVAAATKIGRGAGLPSFGSPGFHRLSHSTTRRPAADDGKRAIGHRRQNASENPENKLRIAASATTVHSRHHPLEESQFQRQPRRVLMFSRRTQMKKPCQRAVRGLRGNAARECLRNGGGCAIRAPHIPHALLMMILRIPHWLLCLAWMVPAVGLAQERLYFNGVDWKDGYALVPETPVARGDRYWVAVDVHGAGGLHNERLGVELMEILKPEPVIVIVPSFKDGYQSGSGDFANQLMENLKWVSRRHPVHMRMFIHGHSGGAQFAHRFAFAHPEMVSGVSAHSAGTWATGERFGDINPRARKIPFLISCGEKDTQKAFPESPMTRIEWYHEFVAQMKKQRFAFYATTWPDHGHGVPMSLYAAQLKECFLLATRGGKPVSEGWSR